jgi:CheY-like chemotaxis protein
MNAQGAVRSEEVRALFAQGRPVLWANLTVGGIIVGGLWGSLPELRLVGWYTALVVMTAARAFYHHSFTTASPSSAELPRWGRRFVVGSTASGVLWGSAAVLFFVPGNLLAQGLVTFAIGGMAAAAAGTLSCHLPAFFGFFVPALVPLAVTAVIEGTRFHYGMAGILVAYGLGMSRVALNNYVAYQRALRLGAANTELLSALSQSEAELRDANRSLEHRVLERSRTLEQQTEALRKAQRLEVAGRLAGSLAHDFNSLFTVIINNASQLKSSTAWGELERAAAAETFEAGKRGAALIRQLLALSRRKRPEPRAFSLNELLGEWYELLPRVLGEGVKLELELADEEALVLADSGYVEQVLLNLVLSASPSPGGTLRLGTRVSSSVELWIEQNLPAPGEEPSIQSTNPYLAIDLDARSRTASMSNVTTTAEQWGGSILVDEGPELVRYRVLFPRAARSVQPTSTRRAEASGSPVRATVLVVDDEPTLRAVMRRALTREGHQVLVAEDGARALKISEAHPGEIDLLLTDVVMPGLSGLELARRIGRDRPGLAVLYVSGFTFEESVPPTDLTRGIAYLPKPFDAAVLADKVRELLAAVRAERPAAVNARG